MGVLAQFKERADLAVASAQGQQGYVTEGGVFDSSALDDVLYPPTLAAVATSRGDRSKVGLRERKVMEIAFPKVVGPESWSEQDDSELAEYVYAKLLQACRRSLDTSPKGPIQSRLNGEEGLFLCKTKTTPDRVTAYYVTRDFACLQEDVLEQAKNRESRALERDARLMASMIDRVPEHAAKFHRGFKSGMKLAFDSATAISQSAVDAIEAGKSNDDDGEE